MTLQAAQQAFRQSPGRHTALAYMDAAIGEVEKRTPADREDHAFRARMQEIRDWLMNQAQDLTREAVVKSVMLEGNESPGGSLQDIDK